MTLIRLMLLRRVGPEPALSFWLYPPTNNGFRRQLVNAIVGSIRSEGTTELFVAGQKGWNEKLETRNAVPQRTSTLTYVPINVRSLRT